VSDAKAMRPKPSIAGLRPLILEAKPIPKAATSGTVTVEVVTPPESYASPIISAGAKKVTTTTRIYPDMM